MVDRKTTIHRRRRRRLDTDVKVHLHFGGANFDIQQQL